MEEMITQEDIDAMEDGRSLIEQAVVEWFGERCPDFEPECVCCQVWREFDRIEQLEHEAENHHAAWVALCDRIEHLDRELAKTQDERDGFSAMYYAEKALADQLYECANKWAPKDALSPMSYRKARGL